MNKKYEFIGGKTTFVEQAEVVNISNFFDDKGSKSNPNLESDELKLLIQKGNIEGIIKYAETLFKHDTHKLNILTLIQARYTSLQEDYSKGILDYEVYSKMRIAIVNDLATVLKG